MFLSARRERFLSTTSRAVLYKRSYGMLVAGGADGYRRSSTASVGKVSALALHQMSGSVDTFSHYLNRVTSLLSIKAGGFHRHCHAAFSFSSLAFRFQVFHHFCF